MRGSGPITCANKDCGAPLASHVRYCVACGQDADVPNVRAANSPVEIAALQTRYSGQLARASAAKYEDAFRSFENEAANSAAIICMSPARLQLLCSDPTSLMSTFGLQLEGESRVAQDNRFDGIRTSVEDAYFPNYSRQIRFAALSLSGEGHAAYGSCSVRLKDSAIANRATVFELPLFVFAEEHKIGLGKPIPPGFRATWGTRGKLAASKLGCAMIASEIDRAELLLPKPIDTLGDCIEVHIYGPLNRYSFECVVMHEERKREDRLLQRVILSSLKSVGVEVRIVK